MKKNTTNVLKTQKIKACPKPDILEKINVYIGHCKDEILLRQNKQNKKHRVTKEVAEPHCDPFKDFYQKRFGFAPCVKKIYGDKYVESYKASRKRLKKGKGTSGDILKMEQFYEELKKKFPIADNLFENPRLPGNLIAENPKTQTVEYYLHPNLQKLMREKSKELDKVLGISKEK